MNLNNIMS